MKSKWITATIDDVCTVVTDGAHNSPKSVEEGHYMASVKDFTEFGFDFSNCKQIGKEDYEKLRNQGCVPEKNDILVGKDGARYFEDIIIYKQDERPALLSSIAILRADSRKITPEFLYYTLKSPAVRKDVRENYGSGSAIPRIVLKDFKRMPFSFPSIGEQRKITNLCSAIDAKIQVNNAINENLEQQAQTIFANEFLSLESLPDGWKRGSLIDIADYLNGLAMQKYRPTADEVGIPVLKIKELRQGSCDATSELCSPNIKTNYIIHDGDVIFSWSGSLLVDFWCGGICGLNQHLFKVTSNVYDKWFYYAWTKHHLERFIAVAADKATTMGHIKRDELSKAEVLIPNETDYNRIGALLHPIYDLIIKTRIESKKLAETRDTLLPKLMSGEIDISEVDYE